MDERSDICLVVEGSYPYVTGGVSSWIQWLMENLKEFSFSIVSLIAEKKEEKERRYTLPRNVVSYEEHVIFDYSEIEDAAPVRIPKKEWRLLSERIYRLVMEWRKGDLSWESISLLKEFTIGSYRKAYKNLLEDEEAFALLTVIYERLRSDAGFLKYYYNFRNIHLIFFRLLSLIRRLPAAGIYHSPGTGYGGLISCLRAAIYGAKSMITEHGIYLQEREMELLKSEWLDDPYIKEMWIDSFSAICRWQYSASDAIITLYEGNKRLEVEYGAREERIIIIPNGIDMNRFMEARAPRCTRLPRIIGFVGRVDGVKDLKTYIQAMAIIRRGYPEVKGLIIGPTDDQPHYFKECSELVKMLELEETVIFTGRANVLEYYKMMDLLLLTSIKEAMPLVVMEAMASAIPVVATDVGACRELLYGNKDDIGPAGVVHRVMDSEGIAESAIRILKDPELADTYARNGVTRIETFYREEIVIDQYKRIYRELLDGRDHLSPG